MHFTFKTNADYESSRRMGTIDHYSIMRIVRKLRNGDEWDIPTNSEEEFNQLMEKWKKDEDVVTITYYPDFSFHDPEEYF